MKRATDYCAMWKNLYVLKRGVNSSRIRNTHANIYAFFMHKNVNVVILKYMIIVRKVNALKSNSLFHARRTANGIHIKCDAVRAFAHTLEF